MHFALSIMASLCLIGLAHSKSVAQFNPDGKGIKVPTISIVGGTPAAEGEFPYVTVLRLGRFLCGGSLIGPSYVLTAAHCLGSFTQANVTTFFVLINTLSVDGGGPNSVVGTVRKFIIHEAYNPRNNNNDVALLVLSSPVAANSSFLNLPTDQAVTTLKPTTVKPTTKTTAKPITTKAPACSCTCPTTKTTKRAVTTKTTKRAVAVTTKTTKRAVAVTVKTTKKPTAIKTTKKPAAVLRAFSTYTNVSATIAGWGTTSSGGSISSTLLKANVTILDNSKCAAQYGTTFVPANMLCAAAPGKDTCQGDSGGPVIVNGVVVGITSFGVGCADPKYAGVYTRVSTYVNWIKTTQANNPG